MRATDRVRLRVARWLRDSDAGRTGAGFALALAPAEAIFRLLVAARNSAFDRGTARIETAPIPVISVGNLTVGGSGKTPLCAWIAARLTERGERPAIVLRGYGRDEIAVHQALNPGVPVVAAARRVDGVRQAAGAGATCAVLDDGFQHRGLARDVDLVLVAVESWGPVRRLLPRGRFREPIASLRRASQVLVTRKTASPDEARAVVRSLREAGVNAPCGVVHFAADGIVPINASADPRDSFSLATGRRVLAISSLGEPEPFVEQIRRMGAVPDHLGFPDHHEFDDQDLREIASRAGGDPVVMTLKEAVKLSGRWPRDVRGLVLRQRVVIEEGMDILDDLLSKMTSSSP